MENSMIKQKALNKEETIFLVSLIEESKIINNKATNATNNKVKVEEWNRICAVFNANAGICRRTPQQLRLKWENLKKNSRKRSASIRMDQIKTGGGPPGYIPPDDILDRVGSLLGSTVEGLDDQYGGDAELQVPVGSAKSFVDSPLVIPTTATLAENGAPSSCVGDGICSTPILPINTRRIGASGIKRKIIKNDGACQARNIAIEEYYLKKKILESKVGDTDSINEKIKLENEKIKLENEKLKLENEKLKLEIEKLKLDIRKLKGENV